VSPLICATVGNDILEELCLEKWEDLKSIVVNIQLNDLHARVKWRTWGGFSKIHSKRSISAVEVRRELSLQIIVEKLKFL
jgi:hypothetical protein